MAFSLIVANAINGDWGRIGVTVDKQRQPLAPEAAPRRGDFDLLNYVPYLLNRAAVGMVKSFARDLKQFGLDIQTWLILSALFSHAECKFGELSRITSIEVSTLSRIVTRLQQEGLLRCRPL